MLILKEGKAIHVPFTGEVRLSALFEVCGIRHTFPCGGSHRCGKCRVKAIGELSPPSDAEKELLGENALQSDIRLACETKALGDHVTVFIEEETLDDTVLASFDENALPCEANGGEDGYGMAIDIGTTTLEIAFFELSNGALCQTVRKANAQRTYGSDVITRIAAASEGKLSLMQQAIAEQIDEAREAFALPVTKEVIVGNTVMLHLLSGIDPMPLGVAPYRTDELFGRDEGSRYLAPCASAFIGADAVSAVAVCSLAKEESALLVDLGTNGEIVLSHKGRLLCASAAAGPALEGGGISCGMPALAGAVRKVSLDESDRLDCQTVGDAPPKGLCGSGLADAVACLLRLGIIDKSGYLPKPYVLAEGKDGPVSLTPEDIRNLQLAKAAIRTAIDLLLKEAGMEADGVKTLYVAGNFGSALNLDSCCAIGLFPIFENAVVKQVGNAALRGAAGMLFSQTFREECERIASAMETLDLSANESFDKRFVENLPFN